MNAPETNPSIVDRLEFAALPNQEVDEQRAPLVNAGAPYLADIPVNLDVRLGNANVSVKELLSLKPGSTVTLQEQVGELVELLINQTVIARGELVAVGEHFGVRIVEVLQRS